jgi:hypothetical protein
MSARFGLLENKRVSAWLLMVTAVAIHVFDEAVTDFLPYYNQLVLDFRERLGFFQFPTFSFGIWLGGLIAAIFLCFSLTPVVKRGGAAIRIVVLVLGVLMVVNALSHIVASVYFGRLVPGFWSSPLLLATAVWVVWQGVRGPLSASHNWS